MKRLMFFTALLISLAFFSFEKSYAIDEECLAPAFWQEILWGQTVSNLDSVKVDTCANSSTKGLFYVKNNISIGFWIYPFSQKPIDLNIAKSWRDIDTIYPGLRTLFEIIENKYGHFNIYRDDPIDSLHLKYPGFKIYFNNYVCFDSLKNSITIDNNIAGIRITRSPGVLDVSENFRYHYFILKNDGYELVINTDDYFNSKDIRIINIYGATFFADYSSSNNAISINISNIPIGIYFLIINNTTAIKFIKY